MYIKPAKKSKPTQQATSNSKKETVGTSQAAKNKPLSPGKVNAMKPKSAPQKKAVAKPTRIENDSDEESFTEERRPAVPQKTEAPKRTARAAPKKYVELDSDEDADDKDETFELSD